MKNVIFVSSSGGHLTELLRLQSLFNNYNYLLVTEKVKTTENLVDKYNVSYMQYGSRQYIFSYIFIFLFNLFKSIELIIKFKPDIIVTTGAAIGGIMCFIAKLFGKKVIYIESIAKVNTLSMTGKMVYSIADKFYVQWEELTEEHSKAEYLGRLI